MAAAVVEDVPLAQGDDAFAVAQGVKSNKGLNEQDKLAKTSAIQAQLDDLDRLNNALSAMSSVSKAVQ